MNTETNVVSEPFDSHRMAPAAISPARRLYWSVRRELWENRYLYLVPLGIAALLLVVFVVGQVALPHHRMRTVLALEPAKQRAQIEMPYRMVEGFILGAAFFTGLFYCLEALYGERRDRSILFWKSLPVSDLTAVVAKASIPLALLFFSFAITIVTQLIMLLVSTLAVWGSGLSAAPLWTQVPLFHWWLELGYHLLTVHALWYAPIYGWLLLVSAWARRMPLLWALLPPVAIGFVEKIAFNTSHFANWIAYRVEGPDAFHSSASDGLSTSAGGMSMIGITSVDPGKFFSTPGLWTGLVVAAVLLYAAARLRRYRGPI
jgi:ABC-2 type transport system permease protein